MGYLSSIYGDTPKMARQSTTGKLAAVTVRQAKPKEKPYKLSDRGRLYLLVNPNGSQYWRLKYRFNKKEKVLALGVYPVVTISEARNKALAAKQLLGKGIDPAISKKRQKANSEENTFHNITKEWFAKESGRWSKGHAEQVWQTIEGDAIPYLGNIGLPDILSRDVLHVIKKIEDRGALDARNWSVYAVTSVVQPLRKSGFH